VDLVKTNPMHARHLPFRLSRELSALARDAPAWKITFASISVLVPVLFGATALIAGVALPRSTKTPPPVQLEPEVFAPPMVKLLDEMKKLSAAPTGSSAFTSAFNFLTGPAASPFFYQNAGDDRERALTCLATAGWYEAGNDIAGQRAVMQVVLNRVRHPSFPKSVCGVVFQGSERTTGCQFSFTCDGSMRRRIPSPQAWARSRVLAEAALSGVVDPAVRQATHFHADYVNPWWAAKLEPINKVGAHIFYRWAGSRGALRSGKAMTGQELQPPLSAGVDRGKPSTNPAPTIAANTDVSLMELPARPNVGGNAQTVQPVGQIGQTPSGASNPGAATTTMSVDSSGPSGRWAILAMNRCVGNGPCRVIAFDSADPAGVRPLFVFVRDSSGMQLALWDCERTPRSRQDQCLPQGPELASLLKGK
jgi:Cell Wall Hydrolase